MSVEDNRILSAV